MSGAHTEHTWRATFTLSPTPACSFTSGEESVRVRVHAVSVERGRRRSCVFVRVCVCVWRNLPVRSRAGRGGACWVWDSRQRRRKHTDTGSPWRRGETAGGETRHTNSWTSFVFKSGRKKKQTFLFFAMCLSAVWIHLWAERHVCVGAAAAAGNICRADDEVCGLVCLGMEKWGWHDRQLCA